MLEVAKSLTASARKAPNEHIPETLHLCAGWLTDALARLKNQTTNRPPIRDDQSLSSNRIRRGPVGPGNERTGADAPRATHPQTPTEEREEP